MEKDKNNKPLKKGADVNNSKVKEESAFSGEKPAQKPEQHSEDQSPEIRMKQQPLALTPLSHQNKK